MHSNLADATFQLLGIFQYLFDLVGAVLKGILQIGNKPVAVLEGNLDIGVLHTFLEPLAVFLIRLEARLQFVQFGIEGIFFLDLLAESVGHHIGKPVGFIERKVAHTGNVLDGSLCEHRSEGDDPGDVVLAVGVVYIFVGKAEVLEVHVDIRHRNSVRVQETLEQELVPDGVQVGDSQAVGHGGSCRRTTSRPDQASSLAAGGDVVLDNQEVVRKAHATDCLELEVKPFLLLVRKSFAVTFLCSDICQMAKVGHGTAEFVSAVVALLVVPAGIYDILVFFKIGVNLGEEFRVDFVFRQHVVAVDAVDLDFAGDFEGGGQHFRMFRKQGGHLLFAFEIFLLGVVKPWFF